MDALIDPFTRDYTGASTTTLQTAVYLRLRTPLGSWWADTTLGSRLNELEREKDTPRVRGLAVQYAEQALQPLVDDGRAQSISITSASAQTGWLALLIDVVDATGNVQHFKHPVKVA
ncbi:phage GP46 family protein [Burkholderia glumae]|uniref:phage GP46 family protein n=1 Tax=Burkholderia glumae TaxID=337 RepID=UPI0013743445|nr:phage GP46 family protein [Burkholderia glumae]MCR1767879.1 phage GP46 family protein [Burkholderia glumae]QHP90376.1 hypothetical protein EXE55_05155 [Burkholderia glumae]UVS97597.1 hypothetical protein EFP19_12310 [Burkholderia glumae]